MVSITCPWCEEETPIPLVEVAEADASFTCPACGTSVAFVEDGESLELAA